MFKKLVRNLPFNPSLISEVGFYARRLRSEEAIRRTGLVFVVLAMFVQMYAVISPPEPTLAASGNDIIYGGVRASGNVSATKQNIISAINSDVFVATVFEYYGITPEIILDPSTTLTRIKVGDPKYRSAGRWSFKKGNETEKRFLNGVRFYERNLKDVAINPGSTTDVLAGKRADGTWFAIMLSCGNPVIDTTSTPPPPAPKPVFGWFDGVNCEAAWGWAYDPRLLNATVQVHIYVDNRYVATVPADQPRSDVNKVGVSGNRGFRWAIPERYKDGRQHSIATYGIENVGARGVSEGNSPLLGTPRSFTCAKPAPPPEPTTKVCRNGEIITIKLSEKRSSDYDPSMCEEITVCINNKLVTVKKYQRNNAPLTCPTIEVCRDGVVVPITSDQKHPDDRDPEDCEEIRVCVANELITIKKFEYDQSKHTQPDPVTGCEPRSPKISKSKVAANLTQAIGDANNTTAKPGDTIEYTLVTANTGTAGDTLVIEENMNDVLEYATYVSSDGGNFDASTGIVTWGEATLEAGEEVRHTITIKVKDQIPQTPRGSTPSSSQSFDLVMNNVYGNAVNIKLPPPTIKIIENTTQQMPKTGPGTIVTVTFAVTAAVAYFYYRSRLLGKELDIVRYEYAMVGE